MKKNTVIMDLDAYTKLIMDNRITEEELKELKEEVLPTYIDECIEMAKHIRKLKRTIIEYAVDTFAIEYYELETITNVDDFRFAISEENRDVLDSLGITTEEMVQVITELKEEFEAKKESEE